MAYIKRDRPNRAPGERGGPEGRRPYQKKKVCRFCKIKGFTIDYKDAKALRPYITERGRVVPRRISGVAILP